MQLVEILVPMKAETREVLEDLATRLTDTFGGVTIFSRAPAQGLWQAGARREADDVAVVEVMAETLDREWWRKLREDLEQRLDEKEIVIRTHAIERL